MEVPEKENQEVKRRFQLWVMPSTLELADQYYRSDNCASRSEFIEKAIQFYAGYVSSQQNQDYLASIIPSTVKGIVDESANRMGRLLFKMAVELAVTENILAAVCEVDQQELKRLRGQCVGCCPLKTPSDGREMADAISPSFAWRLEELPFC